MSKACFAGISGVTFVRAASSWNSHDFKRVAAQTGILAREPDHPPQRVDVPAHHPTSATPSGWR
jgi:hypothetical protein